MMRNRSTERGNHADDLLTISIFLLASWPAWFRGGTVAGYMAPLPWIAAAFFLGWCFVNRPGAARLFKDPVFWTLFAFLVLLAVQAANAGRELVLQKTTSTWVYGPPPFPGWPSSFSRMEGIEMLLWFVPAAILVWMLRAMRSRNRIHLLFTALVVQASLIACLGIAQRATGNAFLPGTENLERDFFAGFGYRNHAGSYYVLMMGCALGFTLQAMPDGQRPTRRLFFLTAPAALLCFIAVHLSSSRAAILCSWLLAAVFAVVAYRKVMRTSSVSTRFHVALAAAAVLGITFFAVSSLAPQLAEKELATLSPSRVLRSLVEGRSYQVETALKTWRDAPVFGVGGWGYRYMAGIHLPREEWDRLTHSGEDVVVTANVHNDPLQFLAEFGLVGLGLLTVTLLFLARPLFRRPISKDATTWFTLLGAVLVLLHSLIDLPFRCPAVLYSWLILVAGSGVLVDRVSSGYARLNRHQRDHS